MKNVVSANDFNNIPKDEFKDFVEKTYVFADSFKYQLDKMVAKRISERINKDYNEILKLLNKNDYTKSQAKVAKIIESNREYVEPWCEIYNECGKDAKKLMQFACKFDENLEMPRNTLYYADENLLAKKVNNYMKNNGLVPTNEKLELYFDNDVKTLKSFYDQENSYLNDMTEEEFKNL